MTIKTTVARFLTELKLSVARFLNGRLDDLLADLSRVDAALDLYINDQDKLLELHDEAHNASLARAAAVAETEQARRDRIAQKAQDAYAEMARASRVRGRIKDLLA